jgi:hypothetical protein
LFIVLSVQIFKPAGKLNFLAVHYDASKSEIA